MTSQKPSTQHEDHPFAKIGQHETATALANSQSSETTTSAVSNPTAAASSQSSSHTSATDSLQIITATNTFRPQSKQNMSHGRDDRNDLERLRQGVSASTSPSSHASMSPTQAAKWTARGALKPPSPPPSDTGAPAATGVYRRRSNVDKSSRRISELSLQLKTKLTYAMIKVQNGWERHSIDEVETLAASALASPVSTTSTTLSHAPTFHSPRTVMAGVKGRYRGSDASRETVNALAASRTATLSRPSSGNSAWPQATPSLQLRDPRYAQQQHHPSQQPRTLAPAADLRPKARHHSNQQQHRATRGNSVLSPEPNPLRANTPTPQEQDAVDTLLFMSSPANSQRFTHRLDHSISSTQTSPSRHNTFRMPRRSFGSNMGPPTLYDRASASSEDGETLTMPTLSSSTTSKRGSALLAPSSGGADAERRAKRRSYGRLETDVDVDRLLDQMRDVASSEEDVEITVPTVNVAVAASSKPVVVRM